MNKGFCMNCRKEIYEDVKECGCGGRYFIFGDKFNFNQKGVVCDCGSDKFDSVAHMDHTDKAVNSYSCSKCGNPVVLESYRSEEELMFWADDEE